MNTRIPRLCIAFSAALACSGSLLAVADMPPEKPVGLIGAADAVGVVDLAPKKK